jgi:Ser/Thr protein kinase RdoA (MazF antagonist)
VTAAPAWASGLIPPGARVTVLGEVDGYAHVIGVEAPGARPVVVKHYAPAHRGAAGVAALRALARGLADGEGPLAVPRVLGWDRRRGVLTQSRAPGVPLRPCLSTAGRQRTLAMAARALAALHGSGVPLGPATGMRDHVADLIHPDPDQMARAVPDLASRLAALTRGLRHWTPAAPSPVVPIHRDCHPRQMLLEGDRVWLVDWDLAARGDAALDVANFAVYLQTHLATRAEAAAAAFLDAYAAHRPLSAAHVAACTAFTRLRLAVKQWRLRRPDWRRRAARLLDDAERALS